MMQERQTRNKDNLNKYQRRSVASATWAGVRRRDRGIPTAAGAAAATWDNIKGGGKEKYAAQAVTKGPAGGANGR